MSQFKSYVFRFALLLALVLGGVGRSGALASTHGLDAMAPQVLSAPDRFGYQHDDGGTVDWIEIQGSGALVEFGGAIQSFSLTAIPIGFTFKFYENEYTELWVNTGGYISFWNQGSTIANVPIPRETLPNDIIAPFWDNLNVNTGGVYTQEFHPAGDGNDYFVVEWYDINTNSYTFEIVLYENGDMLFQYDKLAGITDEATVGIEDPDGVDGLQYQYNDQGPGLAVGKDIWFYRPAPAARVKVLPLYQSGFVINGEASYNFTLRNSGDDATGYDTYDVEAGSSEADWDVSLNGAGSAITIGPLANGDSDDLVLGVEAPDTAQVGEYTTVVMTATSTLDTSEYVTVIVQAAIPVPFAQTYYTPNSNVYLEQIWETNVIVRQANDDPYSGASLSVEGISDDDYLLLWEQSDNDPDKVYTEIEYRVVSRMGVMGAISVLTDSEPLAQTTPRIDAHARSPALAVTPDGKVGVVWTQQERKFGAGTTRRSNIYFALLDGDGNLLTPPGRLNLTNDDNWYSEYPYKDVYIAATSDNYFVVVWLESGGETIKYAVINSSGTQTTANTDFATTSDPNSFWDPALAELGSGRVLLTYTLYDPVSKTYTLTHAVLQSDGSKSSTGTIPGANGWRSRGGWFGWDVLVAWTDPVDNKLAYALLEPSGDTFAVKAGYPKDIPLVDEFLQDYISITMEQTGAVLTWTEQDEQKRLYYALLDQYGDFITEPMIFVAGSSLRQTSTRGFGNASYIGVYQTHLPLVMR